VYFNVPVYVFYWFVFQACKIYVIVTGYIKGYGT